MTISKLNFLKYFISKAAIKESTLPYKNTAVHHSLACNLPAFSHEFYIVTNPEHSYYDKLAMEEINVIP